MSSLTTTGAGTQPGMVLGTIGYMSPEQVRGSTADGRSDIFGLGAILYEMVLGERAFDGETPIDALSAILSTDPMGTATDRIPLPLRDIISRCLHKDPARRFQSAADLAFALALVDKAAGGNTAVVARGNTWVRTLASALGVAAVAVLAWWLVASPRGPDAVGESDGLAVAQYALPLPDGAETSGHQPLSLSRDGDMAVFAANRPGDTDFQNRLFVRRRDALGAIELAGTEQGYQPVLSPDGEWIAFTVSGLLKKVSVRGGAATTLCQCEHPHGIVWSRDGRIFLALDQGEKGIWSVDANGGSLTQVTTVDANANESAHEYPDVLPDGRGLVFNVVERDRSHLEAKVVALDFVTGKRTPIIDGAFAPRVTESGHLVFARGSGLYGARFDLTSRQLAGPAIPLVAQVQANSNNGTVVFDVAKSRDALVYQPGDDHSLRTLTWTDAKGSERPIGTARKSYLDLDLSPDGTQLAAAASVSTIGPTDLWIGDARRGTLNRFLSTGERLDSPRWSPDGQRVAFTAGPRGAIRIATLEGRVESIVEAGGRAEVGSWSPSGDILAIQVSTGGPTGTDLKLVDLGTRRVTAFLETRASESNPQFSPDGRWIAYQASEPGARAQVFVRSAGGTTPPLQISTGGGLFPAWSADGKALFFSSNGWIYRARIGQRAVDSLDRLVEITSGYRFDVTRDGERFVYIKHSATRAGEPFVLFQGFKQTMRIDAQPVR